MKNRGKKTRRWDKPKKSRRLSSAKPKLSTKQRKLRAYVGKRIYDEIKQRYRKGAIDIAAENLRKFLKGRKLKPGRGKYREIYQEAMEKKQLSTVPVLQKNGKFKLYRFGKYLGREVKGSDIERSRSMMKYWTRIKGMSKATGLTIEQVHSLDKFNRKVALGNLRRFKKTAAYKNLSKKKKRAYTIKNTLRVYDNLIEEITTEKLGSP